MTKFADFDRRHFDQVIVEHDLNSDDFEITLKRDSPGVKRTDSLPEAGDGTIKVMYKPTGISRVYRYGVVPPEHTQFKYHIKVNLFKTR